MQRRAALPALGALFAAGCAALEAPQTAALFGAVPPGLPSRFENDAVPFFPQTPYHCGPAALATALGHAGIAADVDALASAVFLPARQGSLQAEMLAGARRNGAMAVPVPGQLGALLCECAAQHAVVVLQNLGLAIAPRWHYAVLVGYDLGARDVILRSGTTRRAVMSLATFERTWARADHWAFVALPPGRLPVTAEQGSAVQAAVAFERAASPAQAARAYERLLERWPENLVARLGLGNSRFAQGEFESAAEAFGRAAMEHGSAAAWNNLAQARLRQGRLPEALTAARQAETRARDAEPRWAAAVASTLRELDRAGVR